MTVLFTIAIILVLGVGAQWIAWRLQLPSILLLLAAGFTAGPILGIIDPAELQREWVYPFVSVSIGIILFEGGLSLRLSELREVGTAVRNLISVGVLVTWALGSLAVYAVEGFGAEMSILTGAILVVTGPTVIVPMLRQVRPKRRVGTVAKWEGITIDPVGAILAVLVLEVILLLNEPGGTSPNVWDAARHVLQGVVFAIVVSIGVGGAATGVLLFTLRRRLVPDFLRTPLTLTLVVVAFVGAEALQHEAGLLTTTLMGIALANQPYATVHRIVEFKENLQVLLIGALFIVLSARLDLDVVEYVGPRTLLLLGVLVVLVRPLAVLVSSLGTPLEWKEQAFLAWLAPRGIVAAAVASLFAFELQEIFPEQAAALVPVVFLVIVGTVAIYGLTAPPLARWLGLADPNPQGVLFVGAEDWVCRVAKTIQGLGFTVQLLDSNPGHVDEARREGLDAEQGNALSESVFEELDFSGIGRLLITIPNDEVSALTALHFTEVFETNDIFQLAARSHSRHTGGELPKHLRGHILFGEDASFEVIEERLESGHEVKVFDLSSTFTYDVLQTRYGGTVLPMFIIRNSQLFVVSEDDATRPRPGDRIVALIDPAQASASVPETAVVHVSGSGADAETS